MSGATRMNARSAAADLMAVLSSVPGGAEHDGDLPEVVHEKARRLVAELLGFLPGAERFGSEQLLQLLRERRLRDASVADAEQFDLAVSGESAFSLSARTTSCAAARFSSR